MKKRRKGRFKQRMMAALLSALLIVGIAGGVAPGVAFAQENTGAQDTADVTWTGEVTPEEISSGTVDNPVVIAIDGDVTLENKITVTGHVRFTGQNTGILKAGSTFGIGTLIEVEEGASAVFENVTLDGEKSEFIESPLLVKGTVALKSGTKITSFKHMVRFGSDATEAGNLGVIGVYETGILNLYDGVTITDNYGSNGIISLHHKKGHDKEKPAATVNMYGGTIEGNDINDHGIIWNYSGNLNIYGGKILMDESKGVMVPYDPVCVWGCGVKAVTNIFGGTITGLNKHGSGGRDEYGTAALSLGCDAPDGQYETKIAGGVLSGWHAIRFTGVEGQGTLTILGGRCRAKTGYAIYRKYNSNASGTDTVNFEGGELWGEMLANYGVDIKTKANPDEVLIGYDDADPDTPDVWEGEEKQWDGERYLTGGHIRIGTMDENGIKQHTHDGKTFTMLNDASDISGSGSYYLHTDKTFDQPITIPYGAEVDLCLNGHKLEYTGSGDCAIDVKTGGTLNLCDCNSFGGSYTVADPAAGEGITIEGGLIEGKTYGISTSAGTITLSGGSVIGSKGGINTGTPITASGEGQLDRTTICSINYKNAVEGKGEGTTVVEGSTDYHRYKLVDSTSKYILVPQGGKLQARKRILDQHREQTTRKVAVYTYYNSTSSATTSVELDREYDGKVDVTVTLPKDAPAYIDEEGWITVPAGGKVQSTDKKRVELLDGGRVDRDGNITVPPAGKVTIGNGKTELLINGGTIDQDGNITRPAGGTKFVSAEGLKAFDTVYDTSTDENTATIYFGKDGDKKRIWRIAGSQGGNSVTLFSAANYLLAGSSFNTKGVHDYDPTWGCEYLSDSVPDQVYANHYGSSSARQRLKELETNESYFSLSEQKLMKETTVYTEDKKNDSVYSTTDKLYLPYGKKSCHYIMVGENRSDGLEDGLRIDDEYWNTSSMYHYNFWLRTPAEKEDATTYEDWAVLAKSERRGLTNNYDNSTANEFVTESVALKPAFKLDLSSVLFASGAARPEADATNNDSVGKLENYLEMTLRLDGAGKAIGTVKYDAAAGKIMAKKDTGAEGDVFLMVQGVNSGQNWYYSRKLDDKTTVVTADKIMDRLKGWNVVGGGTVALADCAIWLETTDDLVYAVMAEENGAVTLAPGESVERVEETISNSTDGKVTIDKEHDGTAEVTVTLPKAGDVDIAKDGKVTVPAGGKVQIGDGDVITLPAGGTVDKDGAITVSAGGKIQIGKGEVITLPDGGTADKDGTITVSAGGKVQIGDGDVITLPAGGTVDKDGAITVSAGGKIQIGENGKEITLPDGETVQIDQDGKITISPGGKVQIGEGEAKTLPNGGTVDKDGVITEPFKGSGTEADPYKISTADDLKKLAELVNGGVGQDGIHYQIDKDIRLEGETTSPWTPIGTMDHPFAGTLDGNGKTVSGLAVNGSASDSSGNSNYQGLFGVSEGTIQNLTVEGSVTGYRYVGGIVGYNKGTIKDCTSDVTVTGNKDVGGIVGRNDGTVTGCTNKGNVTGRSDVGGIVGTNGTAGRVTDNVNSGNVTGTGYSLDSCGAIIGDDSSTNSGYVTGNYYQKTDEINKDLTGIGGKDPDDPKRVTSGTSPIPEKYFTKQSGTAEDPYKIEKKADLEALRDSVNKGNTYKDKHFIVTADISLGGEASPWTPIGIAIPEYPFEGTFDGNGKTVSGLVVRGSTSDESGNSNRQGLFGYNAGTIQNLTVEGSVTGYNCIGGIVGDNKKSGTIKDCTSDVTVIGNVEVGGIVGLNNGTVIGCTNKGSVTGNSSVGGIAGVNWTDGKVKDNVNSGNVTGANPDTVGAIIGRDISSNPGSITGNYYQKTDEINKDLTGIGGKDSDPEGITSGTNPEPEKHFEGKGTESEPYLIKTKADLEALRDSVNEGDTYKDKHFIVTADISLGGETTSPWTPIGTEAHPFEGTISGGGHTISGLLISNPAGDNQGLFGVNAGIIENLTVEGSVTGKDNVGGIAGTNKINGTIKNCTSEVTVTGQNNVGGIAGLNEGTVTGCMNKGSVTGQNNVGGVTGTNGENGTVKNNVNNGNVTTSGGEGNDSTGALVGKNENTDAGSVSGSYKKDDTTNSGLTGIGGKEDTEDIKAVTGDIEDPQKPFEGKGTAQDPYKIKTEDDLKKLADLVNSGEDQSGAHYQIDAEGGITLTEKNKPWTPIGTTTNPFTGTFDGDGKTVSGLQINDGDGDNQGLFGVNAGTIENLTVEGSVIGKDNVGGIAGTNTEDGTIKNCTSEVTVTGQNNVGGIVGNNDGTVTDCTNKGSVTGQNNVGGIAGTNGTEGILTDNVDNGNVTGGTTSTTGAVIGKNDNPDPNDISGNYYQKTEGINEGITGIGGKPQDPAGITSGSTPTPEGSTPTPTPGGSTPTPTPGGNTPTQTPGGNTPTPTPGGNTPTPTPGGTIPTQTPGDDMSGLTPEQQKEVNQIAKELNVPVETAKKLQKMAQELGIETDLLLLTDNDIVNQSSEGDVKGSSFSKLQSKAVKAKKNSITVKWNKVKGADGYQIYTARCGKNNKYSLAKTINKAGTTRFTYKKLKKKTAYKIIVKAYKVIDGKKYTIAASKTVHEVTTGGKRTNAKSVKVNKSKVTIKKGKKFKIKAKIVKASSGKKLANHRKISYESANSKIATVSKKGVIRGKKKGTCYVYVYAENGISKRIKVKVKK